MSQRLTVVRRSSGAGRLGLRGIVLVPVLLLALSACAVNPIASNRSVAAGSAAPAEVSVPSGRLLFRRYTDAGGSSGSLFTSGTDGRFLLQVTHAGPDTVDGDAGWSRDGSRIVFTRYSHVGTDAETHQVLTANADGSNVKRLTPPTLEHSATGLVFNDQAAFSPDGRWIASVTGGGHVKNDQIEHSDVAVMRADGTGRRLITRFPAYAGDAGGVAWSPDGRRLVYGYGDAVTHRVALFVMKADGTGSSRITDWDIGAGVRSIGRLTES